MTGRPASATYLDDLPRLAVSVGYGSLGLDGQLGYEGKRVVVGGHRYRHALSTHAPARVLIHLGGRFICFRSTVALNDDVPIGASEAEFRVFADGREISSAVRVTAGSVAELAVPVEGAEQLELEVYTTRWENCHAVWLDPTLEAGSELDGPRNIVDCLSRVEIEVPSHRSRVARCIATVATPAFHELLDVMLGSLRANGGCAGASTVVFAVDPDRRLLQVAARHGALAVRCTSLTRTNATVKSVLYSAARVIEADSFLCLDADTLVLEELDAVFAALDACPRDRILACREGNSRSIPDLAAALTSIYGGKLDDLRRLQGRNGAAAYPLVVNDGVFAASREALLALDGTIRRMRGASAWVDAEPGIWWRNQFLFNLALAQQDSGVELDGAYNVQLHTQDVDLRDDGGTLRATWQGRPVRLLHFSGMGREKHADQRARYAGIEQPLAGLGGGDAYAAFLAALRRWLGLRGLRALSWSFYGTADGHGAIVSDPDTLPLLAALHYLVRANGCIRVLETGTGRGVSTACLASAVAHRRGGRVVSFDATEMEGRAELWELLPSRLRACIEQRAADSLVGMRAALAAGERYEAALLDSVHTEEQVWAEFELASQLVCEGGLVLVHDARYEFGTVGAAIDRIISAGYGVVNLWTSECGVAEDDHLGLAVIENRRRGA